MEVENEVVEEVVETPEVVESTADGLNETEEVHPAGDEEGGSSEQTPEAAEPVYDHEDIQFGDETISTSIGEDAYNMLSEAGFDAEELTREMYADGEIGFSDERKAELDEKFGKFQVDLYLKSITQQMEINAASNKANKEFIDQATEERWGTMLDQVGSQDNWDSMEEWLQTPEALDAVSDEDLEQFNSIMDEGSEYMQKLAVKDFYSRYTDTLPQDAPQLQLIEGDSASTNNATPDYLTGADFLDLYKSGEYRNASSEQKQKWESMRQKGIDKGL